MTLRIDLTTLRVFVAVADERSITKAGEREHIASSAVSKRMADLEETLGTQLLYRMSRGVDLTPAGIALRHHATTIFRSLDQLTAELSSFAAGVKGHVRMYVNKSSLALFLPMDLKSFTVRFPEVKIELREQTSAAIVKAVHEGQSDIGIYTAGSVDDQGLESFDYAADSMVVVLSAGHPLASRSSVKFEETLPYDFIGLGSESAWDALLSHAAGRLRSALNIRFHVSSLDAVCRMVSTNLGITIAPQGMVEAFRVRDQLITVRLDEVWATRRIKLAVRDCNELSASARAMFKHLLHRV